MNKIRNQVARPMHVRAMERVVIDENGCWVFTGTRTSAGYGQVTASPPERGPRLVHRVMYQHHVGPIPAGLELDHLCRNPPCCNPAHLEAVTPRENQRRGVGFSGINARKTHCSRGHEFTAENTFTRGRSRQCRECLRLRSASAHARVTASRIADTHCRNGHQYTPENSYVERSGAPGCRECRRLASRAGVKARQNAAVPEACKRGHEYAAENVYYAPGVRRPRCRVCLRETSRRHRLNKLHGAQS